MFFVVLVGIPVVVGYLALVRSLRYRRIEGLQKKYGSTPEQFSNLNYREAQEILGQVGLFESPWIFLAGKDFAFLRAFAIPEIAKLSVGAREMVDRVGKRYADTTVLVGEFLVNDIDSERACIALNRMNWIHSRYSKIQMKHMVYTLCLLTCEALEWIDKYDWRKTTALEKHASWVFWYEVGRRMGLTDVPLSYEECAVFIEELEQLEMSPTENTALIAKSVFTLYASTVPAFLGPIVRAIITAFMDSRLSGAFKIPTSYYHTLLMFFLHFSLSARAFFVRHLMLPRRTTLQVFGEENAAGYRPMKFWEIEPWYVSSATSCNWLYRTYCHVFGLPMAGDPKFKPEGYKLQEIGPQHFEGKGGEDINTFVKSTGAKSFTTFGQFANTVYTRGTCPLREKDASGTGIYPFAFEDTLKSRSLPIGVA